MNTERTVRLPVHIIKEVRELYREMNQMLSSVHHFPSVSEIAEQVNGEVGHAGELIKMSGDIEPRVTVDCSFAPPHLDAIPSGDNEQPSHSYQNQRLQVHIEALISHLPDKYRDIMIHRYGLYDREVLSLREIGTMKRLSMERIRQLQNEAIGTLQQKLNYMGWTERY
ncbi:sigma factor-like helix-turn-helix DNA-binding protein [Vibrio maritimus]|uniref:sigma factor-like helix-turn-helix DNA-binding protein n=1 Tax=Vibrio maritimus TaxID=990268 RepID=UPI001F3DF343|nr:sigma factor-like helix-turn-helix DNA-binding protein [Vibrio maritimus]